MQAPFDRRAAWLGFALWTVVRTWTGAPDETSAQLAYLDPGIGSFIVQGIVAVFAGAALTVKLYWHKIKRAFGSSSDEDDGAKRADGDDRDG